jgi:anaerobic selenocysteine-containing dehydrogenase
VAWHTFKKRKSTFAVYGKIPVSLKHIDASKIKLIENHCTATYRKATKATKSSQRRILMDKVWQHVLEDGTVVTRTCAWSPPGCHPVGCGLKLFVKEGRLIKVEGDEEHPITQGRLCPRCLALAEYVNHPDRILYPMKRAREDRGKDAWERISWDEAWRIIGEQHRRIAETYGTDAILSLEGTGRESAMYITLLGNYALRTANRVYTQSGSSCFGPRLAITAFLVGAPMIDIDWAGAFPDRYDNPDYTVPAYLLLWGKAPLASNPDGMFGHAVIDLMKRGTKIITADPRMHWLATKAEHVLRLRPGTDTALVMGLLNVIIEEDLYDHDFVDNWCYGFEEFAERTREFPPEKVSDITWVPVEKIVTVARLLATAKPVSLGWGLAVDQNTNGVQLGQALMALTAITGNLDVPGGTTIGVAVGLGNTYDDEEANKKARSITRRAIGADKYPALNAILQSAHPDEMLDAIEEDRMKMIWFGSSNTIAPTNSAQPKRWHDALVRSEFAVATDVFMTPTAMACADVFLPLSTFAEHDGIVPTNYGANVSQIGAMNKALEMGETLSDLELVLELTQHLSPENVAYSSVGEYLDETLKGTGMSFEQLREKGTWQPGYTYRKYEKGLLRPDGQPGFSTATGRLELYSTIYESFGEDPLPYYQEPLYSQISHPEMAEEFPLIMTSGSRRFTSFHSEHRQIPSLRAIDPDPVVEINPQTAERFGILEGDSVVIRNPFGSAIQKAHITPIIDPRVINVAHGWWFPEKDPEEPSLFGVWEANVNSLIPHHAIGRLGFGAPYKGILCTISKGSAD